MKFLIFSSKSFMPRTKVCIASIKKHHPEATIVLEEVESDVLDGTYIPNLAKRRIEKLIKVLEESPHETACILGSDCVLFNRISLSRAEFGAFHEENKIALVPHLVFPPETGGEKFYQTGHVNGDFILANQYSIPILQWLLKQPMRNDIVNGIFYEQTWLSSLPFLFEGVKILRDPDYNVAYFNLQERNLHKLGGRWIVTGNRPLTMFQYSGYILGQPERMSRHHSGADATGDVLEFFKEYEAKIRENM